MPVNGGGYPNVNAWHWMIGTRVVDGPIITSEVPELGLFFSKGQMYTNYLNANLPPDNLNTTTSSEYISTTLESPTPHDVRNVFHASAESSTGGLPPRHLVVLDLNGSLLFRSKFRGGGAGRSMTRRPYVACLAKYLAHERTRNAVIVEQRTTKKKVHHFLPADFDVRWLDLPEQPSGGKKKKKKKKRKQAHDHPDSKLQSLIDLRKKIKAHPENFKLMCALDGMVWSSVQSHNLLPMVDAAFGEDQSALRACWTRGMLRLSVSGYRDNVQTTKNLETIWWSSEDAYSAKSTVLIDDTIKKARLQPLNLLQIPEFTCAEQVDNKRPDSFEGEASDTPEKEEDDSGSDLTLIAVIGVLEELRCQSNIPAWIRDGGLWCTSNTPPKPETGSPHIVEGGAAGVDEETLWCSDPDAFAYWVKRGRGALAGRGIRIEAGLLDVDQDQNYKGLRGQSYT